MNVLARSGMRAVAKMRFRALGLATIKDLPTRQVQPVGRRAPTLFLPDSVNDVPDQFSTARRIACTMNTSR